MRIIFFVDLVLGPALTLVVFNATKPELKTDLAIIGALQICCLIAGTYVVYAERPLAVVYTDGRFSVMNAGDYEEVGLPTPDLSKFPGEMPKWVMIEIPTEQTAEADFRAKFFNEGRVIGTKAGLYQAFDFNHPIVKGQHMDVDLITSKESGKIAINKWLTDNGGTAEDYRFYSFGSRFAYGYLAFDWETQKRLGFIHPPRIRQQN